MVDGVTHADVNRIGAGMSVTLHFSVLLAADGAEVDTTRGGAPATFVVGDGNLPDGFEAALTGLRAGDDAHLEVPARRAFGPRRLDNLRVLTRHRFQGMVLERGLVVSFDAGNGELPGVVQSVDGDRVTVDFNHPLSGKDLVFHVTILAVEPAASATAGN